MKSDFLTPSPQTSDELYPGLPVPSMKSDHSLISSKIWVLINQIPHHRALLYLDIYDAHIRGFSRQPDVTLMRENQTPTSDTLHLDIYDPPELVVEVVSKGREKEDHEDKVEIYMNWEIPLYMIIDPLQKSIRIVDQSGRDEAYPATSERVELTESLKVAWDGTPNGFRAWWKGEELFDPDGIKGQLEQERSRTEAMAQKLRELGVDPNSL